MTAFERLDEKLLPVGSAVRSLTGRMVHKLKHSWTIPKYIPGEGLTGTRTVGSYYCGNSGFDPEVVEDEVSCQKCIDKR